MADGAALEKRWAAIASWVQIPPSPRRGAGVAYQARLESACRLWRPWVRIPPSPPKLRRSIANAVSTLRT